MSQAIRQYSEQHPHSIFMLLLTRGFDATLTFFCTLCVFNMD